MKRTFQPSNLVRKRRHGFRARMATVGGRKVLNARRAPRPQEAQRLTTHHEARRLPRRQRRQARATPGFVLLVRDRKDGDPAMRVGFTVTKKIGGAVVRNRMKRRFRALAREIVPAKGIAGADHVMIGRAERHRARLRRCSARSLQARSTGSRQMIARLLILIARGWQKGPSQVLPPSCRYQPSCSAYAITAIATLWGRARAAGWPSNASAAATPGAARATTRYREDREPSERQQESDPRGGAERARAARLDLGGEQLFPDRQPAEHEGRERQAAAAAAAAARSRGPDHPKALQPRSAALASTPRVSIRTPSLQGSINLKGAQIDDLLLVTQRADDRQEFAAGAPAFAARRARRLYRAVRLDRPGRAAPDLDTVWTRRQPDADARAIR